MEAFVLNLKNLTRISLVAVVVAMAVTAPLKSMAQDDIPSDDETIVSPSTNSGTPPTIIDESDSSNVSDVEEYDG